MQNDEIIAGSLSPEQAIPGSIQGQVIVKFLVDTNGAVHHVKAISGPAELREECVRVIENVDIWVPAKVNGKKVNSWKLEPINFRLETQ